MNTDNSTQWYKKKRYIIPLILAACIGLANSNTNTTSTSVHGLQISVPSTQTVGISTTKTQPSPTAKQTSTDTGLSNNNYYTNVNNNQVHSPAYSNSVPINATAQCGDGTYSFSQNHRGTCSHHGGVAEWL